MQKEFQSTLDIRFSAIQQAQALNAHHLSWIALFLLAIFFATPQKALAQRSWQRLLLDPSANFFEIQAAFMASEAEKETPGSMAQSEEDGEGENVHFKRWEYYWESRVLPDGSFPAAGAAVEAWQKYLGKHPQDSPDSGTWMSLGPNSSQGGYDGIGRVNCIALHPTNPNIIFVGTPAGGIWKTTNGGITWTPLLDYWPSIGVSAIAIDPNNPDIIYIATGDGDGFSTLSIGVLKSTNGGSTWTTTGLNWQTGDLRIIRALVIHPNNPNQLIAGTSDGIYTSSDAGATWSNELTGKLVSDLEFAPNEPNIVFAAVQNDATQAAIYRSTNGGTGWSETSTLNGCRRMALAVWPGGPSRVYALCVDELGGLLGYYRSDNYGFNLVKLSPLNFLNAPNIFETGATCGLGPGGQGWYDIALAIDPNPNTGTILAGGINIYRHIYGGWQDNWQKLTVGYPWDICGGDYQVHVDQHAIVYQPGTTDVFFGNDGGIYKATANSWGNFTAINGNLTISQMYRVSSSQTDNKIFTGLQDNQFRLRTNNGVWLKNLQGDGMECIIDPKNAQYLYAVIQNAEVVSRSSDGGVTWEEITTGLPTDEGAWITPIIINPNNTQQLFIGLNDVYRTNNRGTAWTKISTNLSPQTPLRYLAISPSNTDVLYASTKKNLWKSLDGGSTWSDITDDLPMAISLISRIAVHPTDPSTICVTLSGWADGEKIYRRVGGSWVNISGSLPNIPARCVAYHTDGSMYLGMDVGIYYRSATGTDWVLYNASLPNAPIEDIDIRFSTEKIRAATFGRGLWENSLYSNTTAIIDHAASNGLEILVAPNPSDGNFSVELNLGESAAEAILQLFNLAGQQVMEEKYRLTLGANTLMVRMPNPKSGFYLLKCTVNGKDEWRRVELR